MSETQEGVMSEAEMEAAQARCDAATPSEWEYWEVRDAPNFEKDRLHGVLLRYPGHEFGYNATHFHSEEDSLFVAHARTDLPAALNTARHYQERARAAEERLTAELATKWAAVLDKCGHHWFPGYEGSECPQCKLEEQVRVLTEALKPFATAHRSGSYTGTDNWQLNAYTGLTYGDLRRAHEALAALTLEAEEAHSPAGQPVSVEGVREGVQGGR